MAMRYNQGWIINRVMLFTPDFEPYAQGQTLTGAYKAPVLTTSPGTVTLSFTSATTATLTWPGGSVPLARYVYGGTGAGFPENGWWWNPAESGRGFSVEIQGNTLFLAGYMYDASGNPIWYISAGPMTSMTTGGIYGGEMTTTWSYTGALQQYANGQAIGAPYTQPTLVNPNVGTITVLFNDPENGVLTLPDGRQVPFTRFVF